MTGLAPVTVPYFSSRTGAPDPALRALLAGVVDYAGLFPPAALDMPEAVANYARYVTGPDRWVLGRFVVPAARLAELERAAAPHLAAGAPWHLSALGASDHEADAALVHDFNRRLAGRAVVGTAETRASSPSEISRAVAAYGRAVQLFVEIPIANDPAALVAAVGDAGACAKVRTGGVTPDAFPSSAALARFIERCVTARVPFKATAGLHHPLRASYRLTYAPDSASAPMYGFLNLFVGTALLRAGMPADRLPAVLEETSRDAFRFEGGTVRWRDWRADAAALTAARQSAALSFGSCSFEEPLGDLRALGLLA